MSMSAPDRNHLEALERENRELREALSPRLSEGAIVLLKETVEAEREVGDSKVATAIELLLEWQDRARTALRKEPIAIQSESSK